MVSRSFQRFSEESGVFLGTSGRFRGSLWRLKKSQRVSGEISRVRDTQHPKKFHETVKIIEYGVKFYSMLEPHYITGMFLSNVPGDLKVTQGSLRGFPGYPNGVLRGLRGVYGGYQGLSEDLRGPLWYTKGTLGSFRWS